MYGQSLLSSVYRHRELPVAITYEMDFFRCVEFKNDFYEKTVSQLHQGNLRENKPDNRFSNLFPGLKTSYWSDSVETARAEIKKHGSSNNILTFWAYDDLTSTFPTLDYSEPMVIIDGEDYRLSDLIEKSENNQKLSNQDRKLIKSIIDLNPDCLFFRSRVRKRGRNFLFFEKGFNKLSIREVRLRLGERPAKNTCRIGCAFSSDYSPSVEAYGRYFSPIAKVKMDASYLQTEEYRSRKEVKARTRLGGN